ncbi:MAG: hypothetical protein Q9160_008692 [Pyrenula sp. 1 TL-2023]
MASSEEDPLKQTGQGLSDPIPTDAAQSSSSLATGQADHASPPNATEKARELTDLTLDFLSTASNETLGACAVGLCATTYFILGRVGLVLIGAVGGVVLHATWEGTSANTQDGLHMTSERRKRKELGLEVARRTMDWREAEKSSIREDSLTDRQSEDTAQPSELDHSNFKPATKSALTSLTDAIIRDYVKKRPTDTFLDFLTNSSSMVIVFLNELSSALMTTEATGLTSAAAVHRYLQKEPGSNLANVLSSEQQALKLTLVSDDILQRFLDSAAYKCEPVKTFLQRILSSVVLEMTIKNCSRPEWINGWIVYLLEDGESEILNVIDSDVESVNRTAAGLKEGATKTSSGTESLRVDSSHQRRISKAEQAMEEAMLEAKRLNEMIAQDEARKTSSQKSPIENDDSISTTTTENGVVTPTSSESDRFGPGEKSTDSSQILGESLEAGVSQTPSSHNPRPFTSFDQLVAHEQSSAPPPPNSLDPSLAPVLTLHKASVTILDDGAADDKAIIRSKPIVEYLLQIEPASSKFPGWMIMRKYSDFESLHEVLRRISIVSGVTAFTEKHSTLPTWKGQSKSYLRQNLDRYLQSALQYEALAECEGMKRFLEKDTGLQKVTGNKSAFGFKGPAALENVGKGVLDVLGSAPKGIAGGGKAVLGGMQGVFGAVGVGGTRKPAPSPARSRTSVSVESLHGTGSLGDRTSQDSNSITGQADIEKPPLPQRPHRNSSVAISQPPVIASENGKSQESLHLPPPPSSMPEDYETSMPITEPQESLFRGEAAAPANTTESNLKPKIEDKPRETTPLEDRSRPPLTESETRVAVELFFAVINELYTLSSAWNIRLAMLNAAKTFLLRPGNPNLEAIRLLIQDDVINANFASDEGLAHHLKKLRENSLPTEDELKAWPPEPSTEEKEALRMKARKLLVERGMPQALTSVMGTVASGEALGRVFDCLQVQEVSRGLIFALLLQGIKAVTQ